MRRWQLVPLAILTVLIFSASAASAAMKDGTWWVALDGWYAQPSNLDLDVAIQDKHDGDPTDISAGGEVIGIDFSQGLSGKLRFGWRAPGDENAYYVSWWKWSHDESMEKRGGFLPILTSPYILWHAGYSDRVESSANIDAETLEVAMSRRMVSTKKAQWYWGVGLRSSSFEEQWGTDYFGPHYDPNVPGTFHQENVRINVKSKGIGIAGGIGSTYQWRKRLRTSFRAQMVILRGTTDAHYVDADLLSLGPPFDTATLDRKGSERTFQQWELEARVIWNVWEGLDVSLGYSFLNWADAMEVDRYVDDVYGGPFFGRHGVAYDGWVLGVAYAFP